MRRPPPNPLGSPCGLAAAVACLLLAGCHHHRHVEYAAPPPPPPAAATPHKHHASPPEAAGTPSSPEPASVGGKPLSVEFGLSSWYGPPYDKHPGANGEIYDQNAMTAAHRTLPLGTIIRVTNVATGQSAVVKITDRGPFIHGRVLDLSLAAAKATGVYRAGVARVKIEVFTLPASGYSAGRWCVQIGAFSDERNAIALKADLLRRYPATQVIEFPGPTGYWVRIKTAQADREWMTQLSTAIKPAEPGAEAWLLRLD